MKQEAFERARETDWGRFEAMLRALDRRERPEEGFPELYRQLCRDLGLARDRGFATTRVDHLNALVIRGHQHLYSGRAGRARPVDMLASRFPRALRREAPLFALMCGVFFGGMLLLFALQVRHPTLIYHVLSADQVQEIEWMYDPAAPHFGAPRDTVGDLSMFAYYVSNNVSIALRTFAWGMFAGVGSLLVLGLNGLFIGLIAGHVTLAGHSDVFFSFVVGHGSFELVAIAIAGVAGLKLGWSWLAPGRRRRGDALRVAARETLPLVYGMVAMLLVAAVIEAFWSSSREIPAAGKYAVGAALWLLVGAWLGLGGRRRAH